MYDIIVLCLYTKKGNYLGKKVENSTGTKIGTLVFWAGNMFLPHQGIVSITMAYQGGSLLGCFLLVVNAFICTTGSGMPTKGGLGQTLQKAEQLLQPLSMLNAMGGLTVNSLKGWDAVPGQNRYEMDMMSNSLDQWISPPCVTTCMGQNEKGIGLAYKISFCTNIKFGFKLPTSAPPPGTKPPAKVAEPSPNLTPTCTNLAMMQGILLVDFINHKLLSFTNWMTFLYSINLLVHNFKYTTWQNMAERYCQGNKLVNEWMQLVVKSSPKACAFIIGRDSWVAIAQWLRLSSLAVVP
ncbi:hypothetical protein B0J17DRAFT_634313 [Rhizoctonia solani]|nr:hypothetical protein B0J17DRAFT_634313 [Rhizoctonia solani]